MMQGAMLVHFNPEHIDWIKARAKVSMSISLLGPQWSEMARAYAQNGKAYSLVRGGEVVACGGILPYWPGAGEAWAIASQVLDEDRRLAREFNVLARVGLNTIINANGFQRVQAVCRASDPQSYGWLTRHLDFVYEGHMPKFGPGGEDCIRLARVM